MDSSDQQGAARGDGVVGGVGLRRNLSAKEAANYLAVSARELKGLRSRRALPFFRIGHRTVTYCTQDLDAFLDACRVPAKA